MKNNVRFFTHEVKAPDHRKFLILRSYYGGEKGWAMEAKFWALNCLIGDAEGCRLDTTLKGEKAKIARALELSLKELDDFLVVLRDEAELIHDDQGILWTDQTQEDLRRAMAVRQEAQNRRNRNVGLLSGDESQMSADEYKTSADEIHGAEQSRAEENSKELASGPLVDNLSEAEKAQFAAWALGLARSNPRNRNPAAVAKKIVQDPERLTEWLATRPPAPRAPRPSELAPTCPDCGRAARIIETGPGEMPQAQCQPHGRIWTFRDDEEGWVEDRASGAPAGVSPPGMCPACGRPLRVSREDPLRARCSCGEARVWNEITEAWVADLVPAGIDSS